jgi:hypothetical protein
MSSFEARLHMPGYSRIPLGVEVDISDERMTLSTGDRKIGEWSLGDMEIASKSDGFHIKLQEEEEEVVLSVAESARFRSELGLGVSPPPSLTAADTTAGRMPVSSGARRGRLSIAPDEDDFEDVKQRIDELSMAVTSDDIAPSDVFGRWLRLLKEINIRHGQGAMPTPLYYRLNTRLLDLIPEPARPYAGSGR